MMLYLPDLYYVQCLVITHAMPKIMQSAMNTNMFYLSTAVNCGTLSNPANGQVTHTAGTTFGQTATYSCNSGYSLVGVNNRTCQATGVWFGTAPTCQGVLSYFFIHDKPVCNHIGCLAWQIFLTSNQR